MIKWLAVLQMGYPDTGTMRRKNRKPERQCDLGGLAVDIATVSGLYLLIDAYQPNRDCLITSSTYVTFVYFL